MKFIYIFTLLLFSCHNNQKENDKKLIELNERNVIIQRQEKIIRQLEDELANCKLNYDALDKATE